MSKKDYELIASIIAGMCLSKEARQYAAEAFAARLAKTNPLFDEARFLTACGF